MKEKLLKTSMIFLISTFLFASLLIQANALPPFEIQLNTDANEYWLTDSIQIYGFLLYNSSFVSDGIVNLQVDNALNYPILFRTLPTGTLPSTPQAIEIQSVFLCDSAGNPKTTFVRQFPYLAYFSVTLKNNNATTLTPTFTLSCYDSTQSVIDSNYFSTDISAGGTVSFVAPFYMPDKVPTGVATVYANVFTKLPKNGGHTISQEKYATFTITLPGGLMTQAISSMDIRAAAGSFATMLKIPVYHVPGVGNYTIYTTSRYRNQFTAAQKIILLKVADLNNDKTVNVLDLIIVANYFGWIGPPGGVVADVNKDGKVNVLDLVGVARFFGWVG